MALGSGAGGSGDGGAASGGGGSAGGGAAGGAAASGAGSGAAGSGAAASAGAGQAAAGAGAGSTPASGGGNLGSGSAASGASWRDTLPDELKGDPTLSKYSDLPNLAKAHIELQKLIGQKSSAVKKPGKDASPEEVRAFREAIGIPTDLAKYEFGEFEGVKVDQSIVDWAKKIGVENGIEPGALKNVIADYMKLEASNEAQMEQAAKNDIKTGYEGLRKEWGDGFDRNIQRAQFGLTQTGGKELEDRLGEFGALDDPIVLKHFEHVARILGEDKLREAGVGTGGQTPAELDGEMAAVQAQLLALKPGDGRRPAVMEKWASLNRKKTGGK